MINIYMEGKKKFNRNENENSPHNEYSFCLQFVDDFVGFIKFNFGVKRNSMKRASQLK